MEPTIGETYRVLWPRHYNRHQRHVGYLAEFLGWRTSRCSLHGDRLGQEALFRRVKAIGKSGEMFSSPMSEIELRKEPQS